MTNGDQQSQEDLDSAANAAVLRARRKLSRRTLWVAPALAVGLTLTRTAAASGEIEPCVPPQICP